MRNGPNPNQSQKQDGDEQPVGRAVEHLPEMARPHCAHFSPSNWLESLWLKSLMCSEAEPLEFAFQRVQHRGVGMNRQVGALHQIHRLAQVAGQFAGPDAIGLAHAVQGIDALLRLRDRLERIATAQIAGDLLVELLRQPPRISEFYGLRRRRDLA